MTALKEMPPGYFASLSNEDKLKLMEEAHFKLASGQNRVQVRHETFWVEYGVGSVLALEREINRLRAIVGRRHGFTVGHAPINACPTIMKGRFR